MLQAGSSTALPASCFYDPAQQNQVTLASGYYRFDINFSDPACANGGELSPRCDRAVLGLRRRLLADHSAHVGPRERAVLGALVPGKRRRRGPRHRSALRGTGFGVRAGRRNAARTAGTTYHVHLTLRRPVSPGSSQIFNNHIPLDPQLDAALAITKTTPVLNVTRGQLVPYTITVRNVGELPLQDVRVEDRFPAGFRYVEGSARIDECSSSRQSRAASSSGATSPSGRRQHTIMMLLAVGAGVGEGEFVNRAQAVYVHGHCPVR